MQMNTTQNSLFNTSEPSENIELERVPIKARELAVTPCKLETVRDFIEQNHYSHSINGVKVSLCFCVTFGGRLVGAALFGALSTTAWKKFSDSEEKVLELRRLVLLDEAGKNSESRVVGLCLRYIRKHLNNIDVIVSYADPKHGHNGIIYKASNFDFVGLSGRDFGYLDKETGKVYHSRALRTKSGGKFKPFVLKLREKLARGELEKIELPPKLCFVFFFKKRKPKPHPEEVALLHLKQ